MNKVHTRINWENYPSDATPINEDNLNAMDVSIDEIDNRVVEIDASKATKTEVASVVSNVTFDEKTGIFTFTRKNGTSFTVNTLLEKIATNFTYDYNTQTIILTLVDGTTQTIDLSALITQYEFTDSSTIDFAVNSSGKVTAKIINGSITDAMLESGYLSKVTTQANTAKTNATKAQSYAVGGTNSRDGEDTDNAKHYYTKSKEMFDTLVGAGDIDTVTTTDTTLSNSKASIAKINAIRGNSEQKSYPGKNMVLFKDEYTNGNIVDTRTYLQLVIWGIKGSSYSYVQLGGLEIKTSSLRTLTFTTTEELDGFVVRHNGVTTNITFLESLKTLPIGTYTLQLYVDRFDPTTANGVSFRDVMLESGSTASPYEPYVGGIASPNPKYPQAINSSGDSGSLKVVAHGKNLAFEKINAYLNENGVIESGNYDMYIVPVVEGEMYSNSTNMLVGGSYVVGYFIEKPKVGSVSYDNSRIVDGKTTHTVPTGYGIRYMTMRATVNTENVQIEKGGTLGDYELPTESTFTIPLSEPLRGIDDVKDEIVKKDGVWGVLRAIKNDVFDGSEEWLYFTNNKSVNQFYITNIASVVSGKSVKCTHFRGILIDNREYNYETVYLGTNGICFNTKIATTVDEWKTWLATNPITVNYELATPIFEPFADEYQSLFYQLESYECVTYITTDSEVQPTIEVEYAVTDAGALMLNNYAKSNLVELKVDKALEIGNEAYELAENSWQNMGLTNAGGFVKTDALEYTMPISYLRALTSKQGNYARLDINGAIRISATTSLYGLLEMESNEILTDNTDLSAGVWTGVASTATGNMAFVSIFTDVSAKKTYLKMYLASTLALGTHTFYLTTNVHSMW